MLSGILPLDENIESSAAFLFHLCLSGERQTLTDKNKTDPGNCGKSLDPVYQSEYRICLPLTVAEYRIAQLYMIQKKSREESTGRGSGVEIIKNEPYEDGPGGKGQYTFKVYHVGSHLPAWLRSILPPSALRVEEEAWNAYPYTRTIYKVPFVDKLTLDIETLYFDDAGQQDNVFKLSTDELNSRIVDYIDIVQDAISKSEYKIEEDPTVFVSKATGRGPLSTNWRQEFDHAQRITHENHVNSPTRTPDNQQVNGPLSPLPKRIMCAYKLCRVEFRYWGMQSRVEQFIQDSALRKTMVRAHRQVWTWQDEWYGLTIEEIRRLEAETAKALASRMAGSKGSVTEETAVGEDMPVVQSIAPCGARNSASEPLFGTAMNSAECCASSAPSLKPEDDSEGLNLWNTLKQLEDTDREADLCEFDDDTLSFVSCRSHVTGQTSCYLSATASAVDGLNTLDGAEDLNFPLAHYSTNNSNMSGNEEKLALVMVVHGGCLLDTGNDLATKRSDANTFRQTLETIIANHYIVLRNRIAVCLVPCPSGLAEIFQTIARLKTFPMDPKIPIEVQLAHDVMPLGSVPLFLTNSPNYSQLLHELACRLNTHYAEFLRSPEGVGFNGCVYLVADSVGGVLTHDLLNVVACRSSGIPSFVDGDGVSLTDVGARRWREPFPVVSNGREGDNNSLETISVGSSAADKKCLNPTVPANAPPLLDFHVQTFVMLGSPVGLLLAFRQQSLKDGTRTMIEDAHSDYLVAADQVYNFFYPTDPCGFRVEPLLHPRFEQIAPVQTPQYAHYPLGDSQPISLVETLVRQSRLFTPIDSDADGNVTSTIANRTERSWEKATMIAFEALKEVRQQWWGQQRVDYSLHCPQAVQSLLARARPPIFHASYWESKDVVSFVLRQVLGTLGLCLPETSYSLELEDEIPLTNVAAHLSSAQVQLSRHQSAAETDVSVMSSWWNHHFGTRSGDTDTIGPRSKVKRLRGSEATKHTCIPANLSVKSNHRANDVVVLEGQPQIITARFVFGLLDLLSMSNEKISIQIRSYGGSWTSIGTEVTDSSGRIRFRVPDQRLFGIGLHPILLTPESDPDHPVHLTLAVLPPKTEAVVFSVDGSFAASISIMGKDPKIRPGSIDVARHWQSLGYLLIYLSARPDMQQRRVTSWLMSHNFPQGISLFVEGISTDPLRQKAQLLKTVCDHAQLKIHCAYGSGKDVNLYRSLGVAPQNIFVVGRASRGQAHYSTLLTSGYTAHLAALLSGHPASRQASSCISISPHFLTYELSTPASTVRTCPAQPVVPSRSPLNSGKRFSFSSGTT
ncbi:hypothetical protein T265_12025 [Opisthorchis viverrini]|uniref:DDHD domain-containing protein n=1 Tax=Opisthorchis viverrini TaxID=6198 RepID=A0A074Z780_OPIVI|nr:hypothetical protein T265_12025 [Opisthorchis viverrini]KER19070.1 hypothetical protein T265_12025 [Opisthorchis viverrini]